MPRTTQACGSAATRCSARTPGFAGDLRAGLGYLDQAIETFESGGYQSGRLRLGLDPRVSCLTTSGFFLWLLGYPDRAVERTDRAIVLATDIDHPYSLAYAFYHAGFLHLWRREPEIVRTLAQGAWDVAKKSELPLWRALSMCLQGAATSGLGRPEEGLRQIVAGIDRYQACERRPCSGRCSDSCRRRPKSSTGPQTQDSR